MADQFDPTAPAVIVSCDSHVGPLLREQLRDYCPSEHLDEFDAYVVEQEQAAGAMRDSIGRERPAAMAEHPNLAVAGHHDAEARLADMDSDGVAADQRLLAGVLLCECTVRLKSRHTAAHPGTAWESLRTTVLFRQAAARLTNNCLSRVDLNTPSNPATAGLLSLLAVPKMSLSPATSCELHHA